METGKEKGAVAPTTTPNTQNTQAPILAQNSDEAENKIGVIEALNALKGAIQDIDTSGTEDIAEAINDLRFPDASSAIYAFKDEVVESLQNIARMLDFGLGNKEPVIPGGPDDWVLRAYFRDLNADDETKLTRTAVVLAKFPVIYWQGLTPVISDENLMARYARSGWAFQDLVLRNGVDISGNKLTKKEHFGYWKRRAKYSRAVLAAKHLPSGADITSIASQCLDEVAGEDAPFPKTYKQFCAAILAKYPNGRLLRKLQAWGYTKDVHENYSAEFYPEGSYWTEEDWAQNRCFLQDIDTHKPEGGQA